MDEDEDMEEEIDEAFSEEDEEEEKSKKKAPGDAKKKLTKTTIDLAKLPFLDNNGLNYLPTMQYFPPGKLCPMQPINSVAGEAFMALIHLPSGGFNCIAIPMEAVEGENEKK
jgi:hypothetical protein